MGLFTKSAVEDAALLPKLLSEEVRVSAVAEAMADKKEAGKVVESNY